MKLEGLESVRIAARKSNSLVLSDVNVENFTFIEEKVILTNIDQKYSTNFILDVKNENIFVIDESAINNDDRIQILSISKNQTKLNNGRILKRKHASSNEIITSQAYDWVTGKIYIAIESFSSTKPGSIEACSVNENDTNCTVVLTHNAAMHSLVVDPIEGYMYWLNKITMSIESAWMNGQYLYQYPYHEPNINDPNIHFAGLTIDYTDKMLYYLRLSQNQVEVIGCKIHYRESCKIITTKQNIVHLYALEGKLYWTDTKGILRICDRNDCDETLKIIYTSGWERIQFYENNSQPQRTDIINPCKEMNGNCSHSCLLIPGYPWKSCNCPPGKHLLSNKMKCDMEGINNVLFTITNGNIFYMGLGKDLKRKVIFNDIDIDFNSITSFCVDNHRNIMYFTEENKNDNYARVKKLLLNSTTSEYLYSNQNLKDIRDMTIDIITGNIFYINGYLKRIECITNDGKYHTTIISNNNINPYNIVFHPITRRLYLTDIKENGKTNIVESSLMSTKMNYVVAANIGTVLDMDIDINNDVLYLSIVSKIGSVLIQKLSKSLKESLGGGKYIVPKKISIYNDNVYFYNDATKTIDILDINGNFYHIHENISNIRYMNTISHISLPIDNYCNNFDGEGVCMMTKIDDKLNVTILCQDDHEYDYILKKCVLPKRFLISGNQVMWSCLNDNLSTIGMLNVCNGMIDCSDGSDERHCQCRFPADEFDCSWQKWIIKSYSNNVDTSQCIPRRLVCNGIQDCPNGADEISLLCALINTNDGIKNVFDFSTKHPSYIIIIFAILFSSIIILIGCCICCHYQKKKTKCKNYGFHNNLNMSTLLSGQRTIMTDTATPTPQVTRLLLPPNNSHQVEVALSTYPNGGGGSEYGYIPSRTNTLQKHRLDHGYCGSNYNTLGCRNQHVYHNPTEHLVIVRSNESGTTSSVALPPPHGHEDAAFYAPPPSAASLSTYGVVKPAEMKMLTPRSDRRKVSSKKRKEKLDGPPSYSEIGSAIECSTPKSKVMPRVRSRRHEIERRRKTKRNDESLTSSTSDSEYETSSSSNKTGTYPPANSSIS